LRVLIIAHGHPDLSAGGAERASYLLFDGLRDIAGIAPYFLAGSEAGDGMPGIASHRGKPDEFLLSGGNFDRFLLSSASPEIITLFSSFLDNIDPDVIHFHHYLNVGLELIGAARQWKPGVRILVTLHEYLAICHHHGLMVKTKDYALCEAPTDDDCRLCFPAFSPSDFTRRRHHIGSFFDQVDLFIAPSKFLRSRYIEWGIPPGRIVVQENGTPPTEPPPPRPLVPGEGRGVFGYFGQVHPFKGVHCLLTAFEHLSRWPPETASGLRLIINGAHLELNHPDYVDGFRKSLVRNHARVHFAGPYQPQDLSQLMAAVDWVVVPSIWWENSPLVIQEAFAHRRPVICSDIGGMREKVRPGLDGFQFPVGDPVALATLMRRLAADGAMWDRLQFTIREPITIAAAVANHVAIYRASPVPSQL
jgi:glycosyltransferase involved in cell wall biosynthesis